MIARPMLPTQATTREQAGKARRSIVVGTAVVVTTGIAMVWVTIANDLATRGLRINEMIGRRQELTMQRAGARVALGIASDPRNLAHRATALGLGPPDDVVIVIATVDRAEPSAAVPPAAAPDADSPLALRLQTARARDAGASPWRARLMTVDGWRARTGQGAP